MQNILMKFDPATGEERPYPSHAAQWREWHGGTAWLFDPWTGRRRDARDVGGDVHGLLIVPAILMKFDPATGEERPYPSHAAQWREWHGGTAWLFDPWTGRRRDARDVGSDVHGLLIVPAGTLGMGGGCSEKDNVACA
jgi:L-ascorbate metabolism protein UlaG (beta-lactamase superfamily)